MSTIIDTLVTDRTQADVERLCSHDGRRAGGMACGDEGRVQRFRSEPRRNGPELSGGAPQLDLRQEHCMDG